MAEKRHVISLRVKNEGDPAFEAKLRIHILRPRVSEAHSIAALNIFCDQNEHSSTLLCPLTSPFLPKEEVNFLSYYQEIF